MDARQQIATGVFRDTPGRYVRRVMAMWLGRWWWTMAVPVAVAAALSAVNAVWLFVALMILCLLVPGIIAMVYYNYALTPQAISALADKTVALSARGITVHIVDSGKEQFYAATDIASVEDTGKSLIVKFKTPRYSHIAIPVAAIPDDCRTEFVSRIMALGSAGAEKVA